MTTDDTKLTSWEKAALVLSMMGQILSIFLWYVGRDADLSTALPWLKVLFGIAGAVALDLVVVTTTMGRRAGRQSWWGALTILAAAVFSAAIALDAAGGPTLGAWNHISYPVVIVLFAQHLAAPKVSTAPQPVDTPSITVAPAPPLQLTAEQPQVDAEQPIEQPKVDIVQLRDGGLTFDAIGEKLGITRQAAQARYKKAKMIHNSSKSGS